MTKTQGNRGNNGTFCTTARTAAVLSGVFEEGRDSQRESWILDIVDSVESPNFFLGLEFRNVGMIRPKSGETTRPLGEWLGSLDPDKTTGIPPEFLLRVHDWHLEFTALPVRPERRGHLRRTLGVLPETAPPLRHPLLPNSGCRRHARGSFRPIAPRRNSRG